MGLNTINYAALPIQKPDYSGYENLFSNILEGYKNAREPYKMQQEEQERKFRNTILGEEARVAPQTFDAKLAELLLGNKGQELKNKYYGSTAEADIKYKNLASALQQQSLGHNEKKLPFELEKLKAEAQNYGLTPAQKQAGQLFGAGTPEYNDAIRLQLGLAPTRQQLPSGVPQGSVPYASMPSLKEQSQASNRMHETSAKLNQLEKVRGILEEMRAIQVKHPNLGDYISTSLVDADGKPGLKSKLLRPLVNKSDLAAQEKFNKLSSDLVLHGAQAFGGKAFTDARQKLMENAKPHFGNTSEANLYVIDKMFKDLDYVPGYKKAVQAGISNRYEVPDDPYLYLPQKENSQVEAIQNAQNNQNQQGQQSNPESGRERVPIEMNGKTYMIPANMVDIFRRDMEEGEAP
jgi:hypothetical protein